MFALFWYVLIPVLAGGLALLGLAACRLPWRTYIMRCVCGTAVSAVTLSVGHLAAVFLFSCGSFSFPPLVIIAVSIGMILACLFHKTDAVTVRRPKLCRFFKAVGVLTVAALAVELFVFNMNSFCLSRDTTSLPLSLATAEKAVTVKDGTAVFRKTEAYDHGILTLSPSCTGVNAIELHFEERRTPVEITVGITDDNAREKVIDVAKRVISTEDGSYSVRIDAFGTLRRIRIRVSDIDEPFVLTDVVMSNAMPLSFSTARFLAVWLIALGLAAVKIGKLHRLTYDRAKLSHKLAVGVCFVVCAGVCVFLVKPYIVPDDAVKEQASKLTDGDVQSIEYPFEHHTIAGRDPYVQQFDAFQKEQLHLDIEVDQKLIDFDAPYDDSARGTLHIYYPWDRAYYDGHYYSYFGLAPLTFYYPYHAITGALPRIPVASGFFALVATAALFALVLRLVKQFCGKVNLLLLLLSLVASAAVSGIWWLQIQATQYSLPILSGLCFLFLTLWLGFLACDVKIRFVQPVLFFLSGVCAVLTVLSRPTMLLSALLLAPAFIHLLARRDYKLVRKAVCAASFLVPVAVGALFIMWINNARFGSPFEFGATYQLTVSNIAANTLSLSLIPAALYHYGFQMPLFDLEFPFIHPGRSGLNNYGRYMFNEYAVGVLAFPHIAAAMAALPAVVKRAYKRRPVKFFTLALVPVLTIVLIVLDFCMAGVTLRYTVDCLPLVLITAVPLLLEAYHRIGKLPRLNDRHFPVFAVLLVASLIIGIGLALHLATFEAGAEYYTNDIAKLEDVLAFWR